MVGLPVGTFATGATTAEGRLNVPLGGQSTTRGRYSRGTTFTLRAYPARGIFSSAPCTARCSGRGSAKTSESEVQPGTALEFEDSGGNPAVLVHLKSGNFVAYSALCTHEGCVVSYSNGQLACPCHGSIFDPANNARVVNGPARLALPKIPIEVRGENVVDA
jgi:Rieske Fe-S protein